MGKHTVKMVDRKNRVLDELSFHVNAHTRVEDHGYYSGMFNMFEKGMRLFTKNGVGSQRKITANTSMPLSCTMDGKLTVMTNT